MSLFDIYKAKKLGANTDAFFTTKLGKKMGGSGGWITESVPYIKRITADKANVGSKCKDTIVGGSIVWNQLINANEIKSGTTNGITYSADGTGKIAISGAATDNTTLLFGTCGAIVSGHKYLSTFGNLKSTNGAVYFMVDRWTWIANVGVIFESASSVDAGKKFEIRVANTYSFVEEVDAYPQLFDLTQMFGSSIADYIYALEQATPGAGIAYFQRLFPNDYTYEVGAIESVKGLASHDMVGKNLWDVTDEDDGYISYSGVVVEDGGWSAHSKLIKVFEGQTYTFSGFVLSDAAVGKKRIHGYDKYGNWKQQIDFAESISPNNAYVKTVTIPKGIYYVKISHMVKEINCQFELGSSKSDYEEYVNYSYTLDDSLTLRGFPKLDSSNKLYYDGDTYKSDGTVTRKYAERAYESGDVTDWTTMITDGVTTIYKLDTPITESADPFTNPQIVAKNGTEEYVTSGIAPVGHETKYQAAAE